MEQVVVAKVEPTRRYDIGRELERVIPERSRRDGLTRNCGR
jgi:hypothetical protein